MLLLMILLVAVFVPPALLLLHLQLLLHEGDTLFRNGVLLLPQLLNVG
jgi:hypothetical protein